MRLAGAAFVLVLSTSTAAWAWSDPVAACDQASIRAAAPPSAQGFLDRAYPWIDAGIMYCQCVESGTSGYRGDCSGYVSYIWSLPAPGYTTYMFPGGPWDNGSAQAITWDQLTIGDALNFGGDVNAGTGHVMLFAGWTDTSHTKFCSIEESHTGTAAHIGTHALSDPGSWWGGSGTFQSIFQPIRKSGYVPTPPIPALDAKFIGQGSDAPPDPDGKAYYRVCAGAPVKFWFELQNTGTASWVDWGNNGTSTGQDVRLGVPGDTNDPFTGTSRMSVNDNTNNDVHPEGGDCNDQPLCRRTVFSTDPHHPAVAPATPGIYKTDWQLVDELRAWFGPEMWLTFNVVDCPTGSGGNAGASAGGAGGLPGAAGGGAGAPDAGAGGGAGSGWTSAGATGGAGGTAIADDAGTGQPARVTDGGASGCACRAGSAPDRQTRPLLLVLGLVAMIVRRPRRRA